VKLEDVKVGMKVVPHSKMGSKANLLYSNGWTDGGKQQGYMYVQYIRPDYIGLWREKSHGGGDHFIASDFEPYGHSKQKFGGYIKGNKTVVYIGSSKGEANYNPDDEKQGLPYRKEYGVALAFCRAAGISTEWLDKTIAATKSDFLTEAARIWNEGYKIKAIKFLREKTGFGLTDAKDTIESFIDKQSEFHSVIIDGVRYIKEEYHCRWLV
jgi:hypothetical protein